MFSFNTTPALLAGAGASTEAAARLVTVLGLRILLVTDRGLRKAGLIDPVEQALRAAGAEVVIFDSVSADPPEAEPLAGAEQARAMVATGILGLGGGSPMDVAKVVALLAGSGESLSGAYGVGMARGPRLPLALIPTTAGTGSEVTPIAILTTGETEKKGIVSPLLLPDLAVLDAGLTVGLPAAVTAMTGIDAMVHAIEAYASASPNNNVISRSLARNALELLWKNIRVAFFDPGHLPAREGMLLGAMLAGQAFANSPVAAVHALAYPIGAHFHVPHGLSNALVLPHVLRFNSPVAAVSYAELAGCFGVDDGISDAGRRTDAMIAALAALSAELALPQRLRDVGIGEDALPRLAADAMKQTRLLVNNPRPLFEADALAIYRAAW